MVLRKRPHKRHVNISSLFCFAVNRNLGDKKESSKDGTAIHTDTNTDLQDAVTQSAQNQDTSKEATKTKINLGTSQRLVVVQFVVFSNTMLTVMLVKVLKIRF